MIKKNFSPYPITDKDILMNFQLHMLTYLKVKQNNKLA